MDSLVNFLKRICRTKTKIYAEWVQRYFEIYCNNCWKEARMKRDCSDYIYSKRCPHCKAYMKNWR